MKHQLNKQTSGFSLIELLVVIFIIGVLATIVLPNFLGARERARDSRRKQDLHTIKDALRLYYNDHQAFPTPASGTVSLGSDYLVETPLDPVSGDPYVYQSTDTDVFILRATLENESDADSASSQTQCGLTPSLGVFVVCAN